MNIKKAQALKLRLHGKSYNEIQKAIGDVSKSTLSLWLRGVVLSKRAQQRLRGRIKTGALHGLLKRNKFQTIAAIQRRDSIRSAALQDITSINGKELLLVGAALYWAEGYKRTIIRNNREVTYHPISLTNSDVRLVKIFIRFLINICHVPLDKIKANLRIFNHLDEQSVIRYWIKETCIQACNFTKTYVGISRSSMGKRPFNRLPYGVIQIRVNDTKLFWKIMGWIDALKNFGDIP